MVPYSQGGSSVSKKVQFLTLFVQDCSLGMSIKLIGLPFGKGWAFPPPPTAINPDTLPLSTFDTKMAVRNGR